MPTARADLAQIARDIEIVVRAGDARHQDAKARLQDAYVRIDHANYPDAPGASVLFRPGATLMALAQEGNFPHQKLSIATIGELMDALIAAGYELILFVTPTTQLPDHHSLAVAQDGQVLSALPDDASLALLRALHVIDNPYRVRP